MADNEVASIRRQLTRLKAAYDAQQAQDGTTLQDEPLQPDASPDPGQSQHEAEQGPPRDAQQEVRPDAEALAEAGAATAMQGSPSPFLAAAQQPPSSDSVASEGPVLLQVHLCSPSRRTAHDLLPGLNWTCQVNHCCKSAAATPVLRPVPSVLAKLQNVQRCKTHNSPRKLSTAGRA